MKTLALVGLALGLVAVGFGIYGLVETLPNFESSAARLASDVGSAGSELARLERALHDDYRETLELQGMVAVGAGVVALVCGLLGALKGKSALGWVGAVLGLGGAIMGALLFP